MQQWSEFAEEIVIKGGFIYLPLLLDADITREIQDPRGNLRPQPDNTVITIAGEPFVKTLSLASLLENYEKIHPVPYEHLRKTCLQQYGCDPERNDSLTDNQISTMVFEVLPHFLRRTSGLARAGFTEAEILEIVAKHIQVSEFDVKQADQLLELESRQNLLARLDAALTTQPTPPEGRISGPRLNHWFRQALKWKIVRQEKNRLQDLLAERRQLAQRGHYLPLLRALDRRGQLEVEGFGFFRTGVSKEYIIYKHTGEYALKDYYGRIYLFPDCRVAVSTLGGLQPMVLDRYKHPFLFGYAARQKICTGDYEATRQFNAKNVILALEEGINALFYGYNSRRRNGYHSLDRITQHVRTVDFDEYRIPADHPKIISGQVEIKNQYH
ncbi:MAG: hypothetical protein DRG58_02450 [Deltaproteobacteria bacterium]|nr:MAG: hypothetical protein DRG58_02450 [Deltaproteobacteria bacterium]